MKIYSKYSKIVGVVSSVAIWRKEHTHLSCVCEYHTGINRGERNIHIAKRQHEKLIWSAYPAIKTDSCQNGNYRAAVELYMPNLSSVYCSSSDYSDYFNYLMVDFSLLRIHWSVILFHFISREIAALLVCPTRVSFDCWINSTAAL
jgi:hypothetical protein